MKLADLLHGQLVRARWGRAGRSAPAWGPWKEVELYLDRAKQAPHQIICLCLMKLNGNFMPWAEYSEQDFDTRYKVFLVEDYYLEIEGLEP